MPHSRFIFLVVVGVVLLTGCGSPEPEGKLETGAASPGTTGTTTAPASGGSEGVGITSPAAGGMSPVTGSDSVAGAGGGGVQQAAKDKAKDVAGSAGAGSASQLGDSGGE